MRVRWSMRAADDLAYIVERVRADNAAAAQRVAQTIFDGVIALRVMPNRGRVGRAEDTCELVFSPLPYIAVYEIVDRQVRILRIRHAAQNWP